MAGIFPFEVEGFNTPQGHGYSCLLYTSNLANNNRSQRHINPWNYPVTTHSYAEWEDEFRDKLKAAKLPLETEDARQITVD